MQYKASSTSTKFPEKMVTAAAAPVAIGTRGTVGSLVRKEIEYFTKFEVDQCRSSRKPQGHIVNMASRSGHSRPSLWFLMMSWKRKKRRGSSGFLPSICSVVEVADSKRLNGIPGFNYRILKDDSHIPVELHNPGGFHLQGFGVCGAQMPDPKENNCPGQSNFN